MMSQQVHIISETDVANTHQGLMDAESIPTSIDDITPKNLKRKVKISIRKKGDAIKYWDEREIKRVFYNPRDDPNRKHAGMQKIWDPSIVEIWLSNSGHSNIIMEESMR